MKEGRRMIIWMLWGAALLALLAGCAPAPTGEAGAAETPPAEATSASVIETLAPTPNAELGREQAIADLAKRLKVDAGQISAAQSELRGAPDAASCPEGQSQVKTLNGAGMEYVLSANGQQYVYRLYGKELVYCGSKAEMTVETPAPSSDGQRAVLDALDAQGQQLALQAQVALSQKLGVDANAIFVVEAATEMWSDSSLGCPQPGFMYAQVITPGYRYLLEHAGIQYEYHAGNGTVVDCEAAE